MQTRNQIAKDLLETENPSTEFYNVLLSALEENTGIPLTEETAKAENNKLMAKVKKATKSKLTTWSPGDAYDTNAADFLGLVLWQGKSEIDGADIVVLAQFDSTNRKTGNMVQVFIMRDDMKPNTAVKQGLDASVCGDCPHRGGDGKKRTCYVLTWQGPRSIWEAYKRGRYAFFNGDYSVFAGKSIRWGAYGDPALIPSEIVRKINNVAERYTGYTHQWQQPFAKEFRAFFQASCDSVSDMDKATNEGWGSFTVLPVGMDKNELPYKVTVCPASIDDNVQCIECGPCNGSRRFAHKIVIEAHGRGAKDVKWADKARNAASA